MSSGPPPPGWPGDLAPPEPLSAADAKDTSDLLSVLEEYLVRCLFSKNWQLREAALQHLEKRLSGQVSDTRFLRSDDFAQTKLNWMTGGRCKPFMK